MQSSQSSSILILDLVSKFLNKVLQNDRNQSHYIKEWESFKVLLSASPLDLNPVFGHLASIDPLPEPISYSSGLNKSPGLNSRSPQLSKPGLRARPLSTADQYGQVKNRSFHVNPERDELTSFQVTSETNYEGLSYLESEIPHKRTSSNAGLTAPTSATTSNNPVDLRRHTSYKPSTFANIGDALSTGEIKSNPFSLEEMLNGSLGNLGVPSTELKANPYHMGFLTSISKQLRDGIERHSDSVIKNFSRSKGAQAINPINEPRSPLRKLKVYEKQKDGASNQLDLGKLLTPNYTSVNTTAGGKLDYMTRVKLY